MEIGFLVDTIYPGNGVAKPLGEILGWKKGNRAEIPQRTFIKRLMIEMGFELNPSEIKPVSTIRCIKCGYVELYVIY